MSLARERLCRSVLAILLSAWMPQAAGDEEEKPAKLKVGDLAPNIILCRLLPPERDYYFVLRDLCGPKAPPTRRKVVLLTFFDFGHGARDCKAQVPQLNEIYDENQDRPLEVAVADSKELDNSWHMKVFIKATRLKVPVLIDWAQGAMRAFGVQRLPCSFLISREQRVLGVYGPGEKEMARLKDKVKQVIEGAAEQERELGGEQ